LLDDQRTCLNLIFLTFRDNDHLDNEETLRGMGILLLELRGSSASSFSRVDSNAMMTGGLASLEPASSFAFGDFTDVAVVVGFLSRCTSAVGLEASHPQVPLLPFAG
jgi:hypothetical protein